MDVRDEALAQGQALLGLPDSGLFRDLDAALGAAQADVAIINTPSEWHYRQCAACIDAGLDVLVAKPITNDFAEAVRLVERAERAGRSLSVGQQVRYNRHYRAVRRFLAGGRLGTPESVTLLNSKPRHRALNLTTLAQPALYEMSCHHFDTLMALFPDHVPETIVCDGFRPSWSVYAGPCMVNALIRCSAGLHVLYHGGFSSQSDHYELRIEGTKGVLRCRGTHMSVDDVEYEFRAARAEAAAARHRRRPGTRRSVADVLRRLARLPGGRPGAVVQRPQQPQGVRPVERRHRLHRQRPACRRGGGRALRRRVPAHGGVVRVVAGRATARLKPAKGGPADVQRTSAARPGAPHPAGAVVPQPDRSGRAAPADAAQRPARNVPGGRSPGDRRRHRRADLVPVLAGTVGGVRVRVVAARRGHQLLQLRVPRARPRHRVPYQAAQTVCFCTSTACWRGSTSTTTRSATPTITAIPCIPTETGS